ncbi:class D beta-lactamase [Maribacter sp.]|uniref:class D beta-lactamase n=1 Tax=Maribacter sp. TaxID=1897614 RepID=UPI00329943A0
MKLHFLIFLLICITSCKNEKKSAFTAKLEKKSNHINKSEFQTIIDNSNVIGSIVIYDPSQDTYYSNDFNWDTQGNLPASTFKIANTIIGLETGVIKNDSTIFKWDGEDKWSPLWEQDLVLRDAFQYSCVPCYQEVAATIGTKRMTEYVEKLHYGNLKIDSTNITNFWLEGESRISQTQQIDFLKRYYDDLLPISAKTKSIMQDVMLVTKTTNYNLSGKTGLSNNNNQYNGWFVGFIEAKDQVYFFATNLEPKTSKVNLKDFIDTRKKITLAALKELNFIP